MFKGQGRVGDFSLRRGDKKERKKEILFLVRAEEEESGEAPLALYCFCFDEFTRRRRRNAQLYYFMLVYAVKNSVVARGLSTACDIILFIYHLRKQNLLSRRCVTFSQGLYLAHLDFIINVHTNTKSRANNRPL